MINTISPKQYQIPLPEFGIRQKVRRSAITPWLRRQWLRKMIRYHRRMFKKLTTDGYLRPYTARLPQHMKAVIRQCMHIIDTAHTIEIAGVGPLYGHVTPYYPYNQCYITKGQCHSGIEHGYTLLFRADVAPDPGPLTPTGDINYEGRLPRTSTVCILSPTPCLLTPRDLDVVP